MESPEVIARLMKLIDLLKTNFKDHRYVVSRALREIAEDLTR